MATATPLTRVDLAQLRDFVAEAFETLGLTEEDAGIFTDALIFSELRFHPGQGQGVARLIRYEARIRNGEVDPRAPWRIVKEGPALALVDANNGIGTVAAAKAMDLAISKAKAGGIGTVIVR
ncbi:MAG: Ldh family oxidoreductase, partial [Pseudomonadota bacterium]